MGESLHRARAFVRGLISAGVREVVLCPGSRSAPLAYAVAEAEAAGRLRLHVRADERVAGFLALGLGNGDPTRPAVVVTTSGTAVANLHPAVLEAHHARVPMILLTADRPAHLQGTWANQTSHHQARMFGEAVAYQDDPIDAVSVSLGCGETPPGPVHVNLGLDDPLYLDGPVSAAYPATGTPPAPSSLPVVEIPSGPRTVVVAGDRAGPAAAALAEAAEWPLFAEPSSGALPSPVAVPGYRLLDLADVERVVVVGRPTLSRPITRLLNRPEVEIVHVVRHPSDPGPGRRYTQLVGTPVWPGASAHGHQEWLYEWMSRGGAAKGVIERALSGQGLSGPQVAQDVVGSLRSGDALVVASSNAIRDVDLVAHDLPPDVMVVANRGVAGIDGTISTAMGVAMTSGRSTTLLIGDLAFLHDLNALALPAGESTPELRIIVVNDAGGSIFSTLEYGSRGEFFERVFGTPHEVDLVQVARAHGIPAVRVETREELEAHLESRTHGVSVIEVRCDRSGVRGFHQRLMEAVRGAGLGRLEKPVAAGGSAEE